jgi:hypothetical protein
VLLVSPNCNSSTQTTMDAGTGISGSGGAAGSPGSATIPVGTGGAGVALPYGGASSSVLIGGAIPLGGVSRGVHKVVAPSRRFKRPGGSRSLAFHRGASVE